MACGLGANGILNMSTKRLHHCTDGNPEDCCSTSLPPAQWHHSFHSTILLLSSKSFRGHLRMPSSHSQEQELTSLRDTSKNGLSQKGQGSDPGMPQDFTQSSIKKTGAPSKFWAGPGMCWESFQGCLGAFMGACQMLVMRAGMRHAVMACKPRDAHCLFPRGCVISF